MTFLLIMFQHLCMKTINASRSFFMFRISTKINAWHHNFELSFVSCFSFLFFIKCMQSMTMTLSRCCIYAKLHVIWSKSLLYIFLLINHIDSLYIQALSLKLLQSYFCFLHFFAFFTFYSFVSSSHFLVIIQVFFKYFSVAILSILMMNSINMMSVFLSWVFFLSFICSDL